MSKRLLVSLAFLLVWCPLIQTQTENSPAAHPTGSITGNVVDEKGKAVPGALVEIDVVGAGVLGRSPEAISGVRGEFTLRDVPAGEIFIFASKASDGFPNSRIAVFSDGLASGTKVLVTNGNQTSNVTVTLRRGGRLSGFISDADTGKPVLAARLRVVRVDHPEWYFSSSPTRNGDFDFAVPAGRPYRLEVTASGYRDWIPAAEEIVLEPNMTRTLDIRLKKASN